MSDSAGAIAITSGVPASWRQCRLKHALSRVVAGGTPDSDNPSLWADEATGVAWVSIGDVTAASMIAKTDRYVAPKGISQKRLKVLPIGTLLYSIYASLGKTAVLCVPAATNQAILGLIVRDEIADRGFVKYWLDVLQPHLARISSSNTQSNLNADKVRNLPLVLPSLSHQQRIAAFLDRKTAAIDDLIRKKERLIELLEEKRQACITHAVTRGLESTLLAGSHDTSDDASSVSWFGSLPAGWRVTTLSRAAKYGARSFVDGDWIETPYITTEGIRLLQTGNVGIGRFKDQGYRYISTQTFVELKCTEVHPRDVLVCRLAGPVGRACLAPELGVRMITSVDVTILRPSPTMDPRFLVYCLSSSSYLDWVSGLVRGGTRDRVSRGMLGKFLVPAPPLAQQQAISDFLDHSVSSLDVASAALSKSIETLREYRQSVISAAVTGILDINATGAA